MDQEPKVCVPLNGGRRFVLAYAIWPALVAAISLVLAENSRLDLLVADAWYRLEGGYWAWHDNWFANELIHSYGKQVLIDFGLAVAALLVLGFFVDRLRPWRRTLAYVLVCLAVLPAAVAVMKFISPVPCPWDLAQFGGDLAYQHTSSYTFGHAESGNCFPSGHASGGFALLSIYFASVGRTERPVRWLLPGLLTGWVFALGQQSRGAHFLSHDLWTMAFCWFGPLLLFLMIRPDRPAVTPAPGKAGEGKSRVEPL
jgi:membrane-associated PAP2 superfamily phosphatase